NQWSGRRCQDLRPTEDRTSLHIELSDPLIGLWCNGLIFTAEDDQLGAADVEDHAVEGPLYWWMVRYLGPGTTAEMPQIVEPKACRIASAAQEQATESVVGQCRKRTRRRRTGGSQVRPCRAVERPEIVQERARADSRDINTAEYERSSADANLRGRRGADSHRGRGGKQGWCGPGSSVECVRLTIIVQVNEPGCESRHRLGAVTGTSRWAEGGVQWPKCSPVPDEGVAGGRDREHGWTRNHDGGLGAWVHHHVGSTQQPRSGIDPIVESLGIQTTGRHQCPQ